MTTLIVHELKTTQEQSITIGENNLNVEAIRPYIYKHNSPAGSLAVRVEDANNKIIGTSSSVAISAISASDFYQGYIKFDINVHLKKQTTYNIVLVPSGGYSFSNSAYIAWGKEWEVPFVSADYTVNADWNEALGIQLWNRDTVRR